MSEQVLVQIQTKMKMLDDVFHNMIIALERLERYLEIHRKGDEAAQFSTTGIHTPRDRHDDQQNPPTLELVLGEVQLQCSSLFFQTKFDDEKMFAQTMKYFMTDLLEWYGGRGKDVPYDEVEMYVLPILVSLSRQIDSVLDIMKVCDDYVAKVRRIDDFSDQEKEKSVEEGFLAFIRAQHLVGEEMQKFEVSGEEVVFSVHKRGTVEDGYNRLIDAMINLYSTTTPAKKVRTTFAAYVEGLPEFTDEAIDAAFAAKIPNQETSEPQQEPSEDSQGDLDQEAPEPVGTPEAADPQESQKQHE